MTKILGYVRDACRQIRLECSLSVTTAERNFDTGVQIFAKTSDLEKKFRLSLPSTTSSSDHPLYILCLSEVWSQSTTLSVRLVGAIVTVDFTSKTPAKQ